MFAILYFSFYRNYPLLVDVESNIGRLTPVCQLHVSLSASGYKGAGHRGQVVLPYFMPTGIRE